MYFLAVDVETTGQGVGTCFMTQLGAALVDPNGALIERFDEYLPQPAGCGWEQRCLDEFWLKHPERYSETLAAVAACTDSIETIMARFKAWVLRVCAGRKVAVVFDTAGFDAAWLDRYLVDISHLYMTGDYNPPVCIADYMIGVAQADPDASSWKSFLAAKGVPAPAFAYEHTHRAADDAALIALRAHFVASQTWQLV